MIEYRTQNDTITLKELRDFVNIACKELDEYTPISCDTYYQDIASMKYNEQVNIIIFND